VFVYATIYFSYGGAVGHYNIQALQTWNKNNNNLHLEHVGTILKVIPQIFTLHGSTL
jgi:hypothetical protein